MQTQRPKLLCYEPEWKPLFELWSLKFLSKQGWRVVSIIGGHEDQLQECAMIFATCRQRYVVDNGAWFMSIYQRTLYNHWHDLSKKDTKIRSTGEINFADIDDEEQPKQEAMEESPSELAALYHSFSADLKTVLGIVANAPNEMLEWLLDNPQEEARMSRRIQRLCHVKSDVIKELKSALLP